MSAFHRPPGFVEIGVAGRAFVQRHNNICAQFLLQFNRLFRRDKMAAAVYMRAEGNAFIVYLTQTGKAEYLVAAAIGKDSPIPTHEAVQPTQSLNYWNPGPQIEVIGVRQNHTKADILDFLRSQRLDGSLTAHRQEYRRRYQPVWCY